MASIPIKEPYVSVSERIHDYPVQLNITGEINIGGVIVAPTGPRLAFISGPQDFLDNYTVDGNVPRNAHITFLNAYYLSFSAGLVIARAMNTTAVNGLYFTSIRQKETKLLMNFESDTIWGFEFGGKYYWCNDGDTNFNNFIITIQGLLEDDGVTYSYTSAQIEAIKAVATSGGNVSCLSQDELADYLSEYLTESEGKSINCVWDSNVGGILISPAIDASDYNLNPNTNVNLIIVAKNNEAELYALEAHSMDYKDGVALTEQEPLEITFDDGIDGNWGFTYGSMAYYHGAIDKSKYEDYSLVTVRSIDDLINSINGINGMACIDCQGGIGDKENTYTLTIAFSEGNRLFIGESDLLDNVHIDQQTSASHTDMSKMLFAIYPDDPQDTNKYKLIVQPGDEDYFNITLTDGDNSETYEVSLLADGLDSTGSNCFIENLNTLDIGYTFVTNPDYDEAKLYEEKPGVNQVFSFGDSGLDLSASQATTCLTNALYTLEDQELYDIEYLAPFGIMDQQFIKNYTLVGRNNDWFTPVDIPYNKTNSNSIKSYFLNVDNSSNIMGCGPFDKNSGLLGWQFYLAASTLYYTRVMANSAANSRWAPVFEQTNGILDYTNPCYMLGKEERTKLLNFKCPVNFTVYNQRLSVYYFNDNRTHQYKNNIVSEEMNRRCVNEIKKNCKRLLQKFKGELNTVTTRANVVSTLQYYFNQSVMTQNYCPNEYEIVCDESNNTTEIINANKLAVTVRVRLLPSIKFIDVLVDVYPLGVEFTE